MPMLSRTFARLLNWTSPYRIAQFQPPHAILTRLPPLEMAMMKPSARGRYEVRSVLMRAGTSKGLFFRRQDLPADVNQWTPILLGAMRVLRRRQAPAERARRGSSTTSKVAVVSPSSRPGRGCGCIPSSKSL